MDRLFGIRLGAVLFASFVFAGQVISFKRFIKFYAHILHLYKIPYVVSDRLERGFLMGG